MKATLFLLLSLLFSNTILAQVTTCDMPAENAEVSLDETTTPIKLRTHYFGPPDVIFTEEITGTTPRQINVVINGNPVFIDAMVYQTSFGSEVMLFEFEGQTRGFYGLWGGNTTPHELTNCTVQ